MMSPWLEATPALQGFLSLVDDLAGQILESSPTLAVENYIPLLSLPTAFRMPICLVLITGGELQLVSR